LSLSSKGKAAKAIMTGSIPKEMLFRAQEQGKGVDPLIAQASGGDARITSEEYLSRQLPWPTLMNGGRVVIIEL
jgi:hypothetical protein